ncbi:hypothetical protein DNTS_009158 [Danionella cerebrum]|uniref:protein-tyrosine-phosphatase n=1 Tax=Danionella cerebrum TaxID=2873325 RepID=A0A553QAW0_9TELE|nr:hypothetical protein DNTS_009158 [Danionella translucida]
MDAQTLILRNLVAQISIKEAEEEGAENGFAGEFLKLKRQSSKYRTERTYPTNAADKQENVKKNRYKDIVPFDHSRVKLSLITSTSDTDYINASFIKGFSGSKAYIATQGPLPNTILDFWRMLWEYNVQVVVMACREFEMGRKKCERYWPDLKAEVFVCEPFTILCESGENKGEYLTRTLKVTFKEESRTLQQLHYVNWPDHGCKTAGLHFGPLVETREGPKFNLLFRLWICSAGCGRTGALCAIDYTWNLLKRQMIPENFSIFELVKDMRTQRPSVVQTKEQYELVYRTIKLLFERYLDAMEANSEDPAFNSPVTLSSNEFSDFSDSESEEGVALIQTQSRKVADNPVPETSLAPSQALSQEVTSTNALLADTLNTRIIRDHVSYQPSTDFTTSGTETSSNLNDANCTRESYSDISIKEQELQRNRPAWEDGSPEVKGHNSIIPCTLCLTVEDPYFGPESPPPDDNSKSMASVAEEIWMERPRFMIPSLALNNQLLHIPNHGCNDKGEGTPSSGEDTPPPLPQRTPESFILADEGETLLLDTSEMFKMPGGSDSINGESPPSPTPPLPERTPESFEMAPDEDLVQNVMKEKQQDVVLRVGKSSEWSGPSNEAPTDVKRSWSRSKSLKLRMSLPDSQETPTSPENKLHVFQGTVCLTPQLQERTPELSKLQPAKVIDNSTSCRPAEAEQQRLRVGTSSEWSGTSQPKSFLDKTWIRSKSVRGKSSKQVLDNKPPAAENPSKETLVTKARNKSIKLLRGRQRPKVAPPPTPPTATSIPPPPTRHAPPPYAAAVGVVFSFGTRFGKPKGPRNKPETWV